MCGIIGAISGRDISRLLLDGLRRLEYRGYDSAGIAIVDSNNQLSLLKIQGKVQILAHAMLNNPIAGSLGIAHTRWATHGKPCELNAHPQSSHGELAIVHNGIIENHEILKQKLIDLGYNFISETDTEVAAHLIRYYYQTTQDLLLATQAAANSMIGAFAIGVIHRANIKNLIAYRKGSPLVVGIGVDGNYIASDATALKNFAQEVIYLEEGDSARILMNEVFIFDANNNIVERQRCPLENDIQGSTKGRYRHFMLKEIHEQNDAVAHTIEGRISSIEVLRASFGEHATKIFPKIKQIHIVACGTSYHASLIARYWLESLSKLPVQVDIASEYRYRDIVIPEATLFIAVSQSGETADTLAALNKAKSLGYISRLAICNVAMSTLVHEAECAFLTHAGIEIGVASTKAFTTQLTAFLMLACALSDAQDKAQIVLDQLRTLPSICKHALAMDRKIAELAQIFIHKQHALFLGRGAQYPVALEGALKLKEVSYIHAEAYPAGELKHGPLALVDKEMPVIAVMPNDELLSKLKSNLTEINTRGGQLIIFIDQDQEWQMHGAHLISMPTCGSWIAPIIYTIPLQLLAYYVAVAKGTDVDQPRNLAKSVTVE